MKTIAVACAVIKQEGKILCAQRSAKMSMALKWEFPGGKIEREESAEACVRREVREELGVDVVVGEPLAPLTHDYGSFSVSLFPFICEEISGTIRPREHEAVVWLAPEDLPALDWAEADRPLIEWLSQRKGNGS